MKSLIPARKCKNIGEIRNAIDLLDEEIIRLLEARDEYVREIVKFKSGDEKGIIAQERKDLVLKQRKALAVEKGLDGDMVEGIFRLLIEKNIQIQFDINNKVRK